MRIAYITAGAGGMYCGSCLHDNTLASALIVKGHDVALIPTYTPIRTDEDDVSIGRVFYGGINVYLQEKFSLFRHTPAFLDSVLNRPALLKWIAKMASSTNAKDLGSLTVSTLMGADGNQRKELKKLVEWLKDEYKPDIVHLTNTMFLGFVREIKRNLGIPVLCSIQGEDLFLDELIEPYKSDARRLLLERVKDIDALVSTSTYYSRFMSGYLDYPEEKIHTVPLGIKLEGHGIEDISFQQQTFVIGYLARLCPEKGLHILIDAFHRLWKIHGAGNVLLKIAGYLSPKDKGYFEEQMQKVRKLGMAEDVEYLGEVDRLSKIVFLNTLDVLSVPTVYREPKGLFVLEALANGVPVVLPDHGAFPELIDSTGGGLVVEPGSPEAVAKGIQELMNDAEKRHAMGKSGKAAVHDKFSDAVMAARTVSVYDSVLKRIN